MRALSFLLQNNIIIKKKYSLQKKKNSQLLPTKLTFKLKEFY